MLIHLAAVSRHQIITTGGKQMLGVIPRRANQGYAAGQRLKWPDRGNTGQCLYVRSSRYMHSDPASSKYPWCVKIRKPTTIGNARVPKRVLREFRITNSKNFSFEF